MPEGEIVFYRNYGAPAGERYVRLSKDLELGSSVYSLAPTPAWRALMKAVAPEEEENPFPVVFAEERLFPDGKSYLVGAQLCVRRTGDGFLSPGPEIWCNLFTIDRSNPDTPKLLWRGSVVLGTLQNSWVERGVADPANKSDFILKKTTKGSEGKSVEGTCRFETTDKFKIGCERIHWN